LGRSREQEIIEEARKYVDAVRNFDDVGQRANTFLRDGVAQLVNAESREEYQRISEEQQARVRHTLSAVLRTLTAPIQALNSLVEPSGEPVYFTHGGQEMRVVPKRVVPASYRRFDVQRKDGASWTSL
jgi:hypothetical protein